MKARLLRVCGSVGEGEILRSGGDVDEWAWLCEEEGVRRTRRNVDETVPINFNATAEFPRFA